MGVGGYECLELLEHLTIPLSVNSFIVQHKPGNYKKEHLGSGLKMLAKNLNPRSYESYEILGSIRPAPWAYNLSIVGHKI